MTQGLTFADIFCNALDQDYTHDQAMDDLINLMNESIMLEIQGKTDSPRFTELLRIIPVQERLAKAKLDNHPIFHRLGTLKARIYKPH